MKFSKQVVTAVVALNIVFTAAVFILCWRGLTVPDSLIVAWFAFTGGELWALASIKKSRIKKDGDSNDQNQ